MEESFEYVFVLLTSVGAKLSWIPYKIWIFVLIFDKSYSGGSMVP